MNRMSGKETSKPVNDSSSPGSYPGSLSPHLDTVENVLNVFNLDPIWGLSKDDVNAAFGRNGPNLLKPPKRPSRLAILTRQIMNAMTIVLIAAMAVSFGTMDWIAAGFILLLVIINVSVGFTRV